MAEIADDVHGSGWRAALRKQNGRPAGSGVVRDVCDQHCMPVGSRVRRCVDQHVARGYFPQGLRFHLTPERGRVRIAVNVAQVLREGPPAAASRISLIDAPHRAELNPVVLSLFPEVFRAHPHDGIGALFRVGQHGQIQDGIAEALPESGFPIVVLYAAAAFLKGESPQEFPETVFFHSLQAGFDIFTAVVVLNTSSIYGQPLIPTILRSFP